MIYLDFIFSAFSVFLSSAFFSSFWWPMFAFGVLIGCVVLIRHLIFISSK